MKIHVSTLNKMKNIKIIIIFSLLILSFQMFCQKKSDKNIYEIRLDINNDKVEDLVIHNKKQNHYEFKYNNGKLKYKKITFFENYDSTSVNMDLKVVKNFLVFEMRYAPKYLDKNILSFSYDELKDDWLLKSIYSQNFNPMDPDLIKTKCIFELKKQISLNNNNADDIIQYIGFDVMSLNSNLNFVKINCICEKTETELDINAIRDRMIETPILDEPKKLRLDLYIKENPFYSGNLKPYNDIASKLKDNNSSNEAIYILKKIIAKFPNSIDSNLNIADSYWNINKTKDAKFYYKKYISLIKSKNKIPKRVYVRIK